jgi:hypothetical protein
MLAVLLGALGSAATAALSAQSSARLRTNGLVAQPAGTDSTRISVRLAGVPVADALAQLVQASGISLVYDDAVLLTPGREGRPVRDQRIFCKVTAAPPEALLLCIVREAGLDFYRLSSGTYVVIASAEALPAMASVSGVVIDESTRAPIAQAVVQMAERDDARVANQTGHFAFTALPPGRYRLVVRAIGYAPLRTELTLPPNGRLRQRFALTQQQYRSTPIVVNGIQPGATVGLSGAATLDAPTISALVQGPGLVLPGAPMQLGLTRRDGVGDLHLQGGEAGEHLWRLDGVPVFDAAGLSGLFGSFAPLAIEQLTVQRAGFGARGGSVTAGTLDLTHGLPAVGTAPSMTMQVDPIAASARLDLPMRMGGRRWDSRLTGRTGVWPWYAPGALSRALTAWNAPDPVLMQRLTLPGAHDSLAARRYAVAGSALAVDIADLHLASRLELSPFQQVDASVHWGQSGVGAQSSVQVPNGVGMTGQDDYVWQTRMAQLRHRWLIGTRATHAVQLHATRHELVHRMAVAASAPALAGEPLRWDGNGITEAGLTSSLTVDGGADWSIDAGASLVRSTSRLDLENGVTRSLSADVQLWRSALHVDLTRRLFAGVWLDAGVRLTQLDVAGRGWTEPRAALRGDGHTAWLGSYAWRLAGGTYRQFVNQFDVATTMPIALVPSVRFWLPADGSRGVATAHHLAAEFMAQPSAGWEVRMEGYVKRQPTILAFDYAALLDQSITSAAIVSPLGFVAPARGEAMGAGVRVIRDQWNAGAIPLRLEVGYDAGRALRTFPSRFGGRLQPAPWNEPHRLLAAIDARPVRGLRLGVRARAVFGRSWGLRQSYYDLLSVHRAGNGLPIGDPSALERPTLIDTDLGASWTRSIVGWQWEVGVALQNALNRANVLDYTLRQEDAAGSGSGFARDARFLPGRQLLVSMRLTR